MVGSLIGKYRRWRLRIKGLDVPSDCRLMDIPHVGSEPYLISIGRHVTISSDVTFITHDGGTWVFRDESRYRRVIKFGRIVIHDNCFIGARAMIMPGVSIGPNAVVAAGAVVTRNVPPNTVVAGIPARVLCTRAEYAENALRSTPHYDVRAYAENKKRELLRVVPMPVNEIDDSTYDAKVRPAFPRSI